MSSDPEMSDPEIVVIAAVARNGVIGRNGQLPWRLASDLKRFKRRTMGHALLMGRTTHESIGRPLPGRTNIVISRNPAFTAPGCHVVSSWQQALSAVPAGKTAFAIGGYQVFLQALPRAARLYFTRVQADIRGDVCFPPVDWRDWQEIERVECPADENNEWPHTFIVMQKVPAKEKP